VSHPVSLFARRRVVRAACASLALAVAVLLLPPVPFAAAAPVAAAPAPSTASFTFPTQTLTVPAGFTVELVAGPPLVDRPISIAFDEAGRLYATDSSGLSDRSDKQILAKPHRVVRLDAADGAGRFTSGRVFADRLMFPQGALFHEGAFYTAAPPEIWKLTPSAPDGDAASVQRAPWFDGKTLTGCANDLHGPYLGPDGWIYWTKGAFAEQRHTLGNGRAFTTRASHIFRARPDGGGLEPVLTGGMDNPVGLAFSPTGERFLSGTFFQIGVAGQRDGLIHSIYGGVYGKENAALAGHPRTGDLMPMMTHMGAAAPAGATAYRSGAFGDGYRDNLFVSYFNLHKIVRHELVPDGATFTTRDTDFLTSDNRDFHPTDVLEDADGSLLVVDTGGWYKICCPTSQLAKPDVLGALYRIRKTGAPAPADPRGQEIAWAALAPTELTKFLADERPYVRERAIAALGKLGAPAIAALRTAATGAASPGARRNALWALSRIAGPTAREAVHAALTDADAGVVHTALQTVSLWRDAAAFDALVGLLTRENPVLVRMAAEALGRLGDPRAVEPLFAAIARLGETKCTATGAPAAAAPRVLDHSLTYALMEIADRGRVAAQLKRAAHPRAIRAALVALDQMESGGLVASDVVRWLDAPDPMVRQTAAWVAGHHPEWGDALANFFRRQIARAAELGETDRADLGAQLARLAPSPAIQDLLASVAIDAAAPGAARQLALRAMATAGLKESPTRWLAALAAVLTAGERAPTREAVATARVLPWPKSGHAELAMALARLGRDEGAPDDVRLDALATAPVAALGALEPGLFDFLVGQLGAMRSLLARGAAAGVLAKAPLAAEQRLALADALKTVGALELPKLLPAFEKSPSAELGERLVAALRASPGVAGLRAARLTALFAAYPANVRARAAELAARLDADAARQSTHVDELLARTRDGDIRRGQAVFHSDKAACKLCHTLGYLGGRLGPDLTSIGKLRTERDLLEAVVWPSATMVRGFEPLVVTTKSGETHTGLVRKDAADEIVLATGPDTERRLARNEIADVQPGTVSPMPPGYEATLSTQELADLIAFLKSRQ
jgi:putative membrane-bound dehydrogenase-like protein